MRISLDVNVIYEQFVDIVKSKKGGSGTNQLYVTIPSKLATKLGIKEGDLVIIVIAKPVLTPTSNKNKT